MEDVPTDAIVKQFQFTKTVYRDQYPSIDPTNPALSQQGKVVIVTGASQGLGQAISLGYAKAGAAGIVLVSRNVANLEATKAQLLNIRPAIDVLIVPTDVSSIEDVSRMEDVIRQRFGSAHVLVNNAGILLGRSLIAQSDPTLWCKDFDVNFKGSYLVTRAFLRLIVPDASSYLVNVASYGSELIYPSMSSYCISKFAQVRLSEYVAAEAPHVQSISFDPGSVPTAILDGHSDLAHFAYDTPELAAGVAVYLASPKAAFLSGRYIHANWSVDELEAHSEEIVKGDLLKFSSKGEFGDNLFKS